MTAFNRTIKIGPSTGQQRMYLLDHWKVRLLIEILEHALVCVDYIKFFCFLPRLHIGRTVHAINKAKGQPFLDMESQKVFTMLDLRAGYNELPVAENHTPTQPVKSYLSTYNQ